MAKGRPRAFDTDKALDAALKVFWRKGYEGSSLSDLTEAMGINPPSLYAAFGNKEALFRKALDRYAGSSSLRLHDALAEPSARRVVERLLRGAAEMLTDPCNPPGCLMVQGALSCSDTAQSVREELIARRSSNERELCHRLERAKADGDLPEGAEPADLARYLNILLQGMAVQAASGATRAELDRVTDLALRIWPG